MVVLGTLRSLALALGGPAEFFEVASVHAGAALGLLGWALGGFSPMTLSSAVRAEAVNCRALSRVMLPVTGQAGRARR